MVNASIFPLPMREKFFRLALAALLCAALPAGAQSANPPKKVGNPVPPGAKVSLVFERHGVFSGEDVSFQFVLENTGKEAFDYETGGDYRGSSRALRFKITAADAEGQECEDPDPEQQNFGGLAGSTTLAPGQKYVEKLWLPALPDYRETRALYHPGLA